MKKEHRVRGEVSVRVKGKNLTVTPALHDQVVNKMQRLDKYLDRLEKIEVELATESARDADQHSRVEAMTRVAGHTIRVTAVDREMYAAIDAAVDKLYRQLNRQKERIKGHQASKLSDVPGAPAGVESDKADERADDAEIRVERVDLEPIFEDEAAEQMRMSGREFLVFLNARNEQINVLYRREDGSLTLVEPRVR